MSHLRTQRLKTCYSLSICWLLTCVLVGSFLQSVREGLRTGTERVCCLPDVAQQGTRNTGFTSPGFRAFCSPWAFVTGWLRFCSLEGDWQVSAEGGDLANQSPSFFHFQDPPVSRTLSSFLRQMPHRGSTGGPGKRAEESHSCTSRVSTVSLHGREGLCQMS